MTTTKLTWDKYVFWGWLTASWSWRENSCFNVCTCTEWQNSNWWLCSAPVRHYAGIRSSTKAMLLYVRSWLLSRVLLFSPRGRTSQVTPLTLSSSMSLHHSPWVNLKFETHYTITIIVLTLLHFSSVGLHRRCHNCKTVYRGLYGPAQKNPDKIRISGFGVKK